MSLLISTHDKVCIKKIAVAALLLIFLVTEISFAWEIDLSRRRRDVQKRDATTQAPPPETGFLDNLLPVNPAAQEIVILATENGFVPKTVRVKKDVAYTIYVVNVNEKEKNVSFILDAFSEHHGTYFGKIKKFEITPKKEGIYSFYCPEASFEGRMVVYHGEPQSRGLASPQE